MRVSVDMDLCQAYGECVFAAPDVFDLEDDAETVTVVDDSPDDAKRDQVEKAAGACPVSAITVDG